MLTLIFLLLIPKDFIWFLLIPWLRDIAFWHLCLSSCTNTFVSPSMLMIVWWFEVWILFLVWDCCHGDRFKMASSPLKRGFFRRTFSSKDKKASSSASSNNNTTQQLNVVTRHEREGTFFNFQFFFQYLQGRFVLFQFYGIGPFPVWCLRYF